jgi:hypothetical protein
MDKLDKKNYNAVIERGLITLQTNKLDFYEKAEEELKEIYEACDINSPNTMADAEAMEVMDAITALKNALIFCGRDPREESEKVLIKNRSRAI